MARIIVDPDISHGKPSVRGLCYPVVLILELLSGSISAQEVPKDYDDLKREGIHAVLLYAARLTQVRSAYGCSNLVGNYGSSRLATPSSHALSS